MGARVGEKNAMYAVGLIGTITVILVLFIILKWIEANCSILFDLLAIMLLDLIAISILAIGGTLALTIGIRPKMVLQFLGLPNTPLFQGIMTGLGMVMFSLEILLFLRALDKTFDRFS